ncbi:MAG TPA: tetratricopeptide repeat protein [Candidatus Limnocylindrales bacterium]|nr:tetratricopeptide repeat protein [Candidatus Limnocylindrales bacterium]
MIERLLAAERALAGGELDQAERMFRQVADADERNAIAVVGLAEVALARGDAPAARALATRALAIDPDDAAAARLLSPGVAPGAPAVTPEPAEAPETPTTAPGRQSLAGRLRAWFARLLGRPA